MKVEHFERPYDYCTVFGILVNIARDYVADWNADDDDGEWKGSDYNPKPSDIKVSEMSQDDLIKAMDSFIEAAYEAVLNVDRNAYLKFRAMEKTERGTK
jgi:hypothetical protein